MVTAAEATADYLDPTYPARQRASTMLNLPYVASLRQLEFHLHQGNTMAMPVLYGGAMGGGKSAAICAEAIRECIEIPGNRVLMARKILNTFKNSTLQTLLGLMPDYVMHRPSASRFIFPNDSQIIYTGLGTEADRQKHRSAEYGAIFIDEATEVDYMVFLEISGRLRWKPAAEANRLKFRLTCNPEPGWVKEEFITNRKPGFDFIGALPTDNPHLPMSYVEDYRRALPPHWFRAYMLGDWDAFTAVNVVLSPRLVEDALRRSGTSLGTDCVWGVDVARYGNDATVIARRRGLQFDYLDRLPYSSVDDVIATVASYYHIAAIKPDAINVDDDGVGGGVTDGLRKLARDGKLGAVQVNAVIAQGAARDSEHYAMLKAELWFKFKALLESNAPVRIVPLTQEREAYVKGDLTIHRYEVKGGKAYVEPKKLVKQRQGHSPDEGDALILTMYDSAGQYVAYEDPEQALRRSLASLGDEERQLLAMDMERRRRTEARQRNFAARYGVGGLLDIDDDPNGVPY